MPQVGDVLLNKYRILRQLGEGGMGAVYEAEHAQIGKHVAVKVLHKELSEKPDLVARFTREAQAAGAIGHVSIIDVYDIGTSDDGSLCMVMEFLDGQNLAQVIKQTRAMADMNLALYIVCQTLSALHAAHEKDIVHRDLKPDNIFLVRTGQAYPDIKLLDFGISKMLMTGTPEDRLTRTGTIMGTPFYMAPEQARGKREVDHRVDLYAMGVILYECLTGRVPFWADNTFALVYEILNSPVPPPRQLRPEIPEDLEQIIMRALARDPEQRFQSALEMLQVLFPYLDEHAKGRVSLPLAAQGAVPGAAGVESIPGMARGPSGAVISTPGTGTSGVLTPGTGTSGVLTPGTGTSGVLTPGTGTLGVTTPAPGTPGTPMAWTAGGQTGATEPRKGKVGLIVGVIAACVVLGGIVAVVVALAIGGGDEVVPQPPPTAMPTPPTAPIPTPTPTPVPVGQPVPTSTPDASAGAAPDTGAVAAAPEPATVSITLDGLPDGATVTLDGQPVEGNVLEGPRSDAERTIVVRADGHRDWTQSVAFNEDRTVTVTMQPLARASGSSHRRGNRGDSSSRRGSSDRRPPRRPGRRGTPRFVTSFD